ncbi:MAG: hypothetical protein E6G66_19335 [Actinobacteria bacterium]|nr:MAG: hypothetical protein E6G66_19335 [Actinomycetota bacterium]
MVLPNSQIVPPSAAPDVGAGPAPLPTSALVSPVAGATPSPAPIAVGPAGGGTPGTEIIPDTAVLGQQQTVLPRTGSAVEAPVRLATLALLLGGICLLASGRRRVLLVKR